MSIIVIEGGSPNGTDLVVGEANGNPIAQAKKRGEEIVKVAHIGDGFAILGVSLEAVPTEDGKLAVFAVMNGCKPSAIVGIDRVVKIAVGKVGEIDINALKANIAKGLGETWEPVAEVQQ